MQLTDVLPEKWALPATKAEVAMLYGLGSTPASSPCPFFVPQSCVQQTHTEFLPWPGTEVVKTDRRRPSLGKPDRETRL